MTGRTDKALVLRRVDVGESDRVVVLYTRESGKVATIARGARQSKKRFAGSLEPFCLLRVELQHRKHSDLALLAASEVETAFSIFLKNLDATCAGWRLLELLDAFEQDHHANPSLFDQILTGIYRLQTGEISPAAWRLCFEATLLTEAGLAPRLDCCLRCEKALAASTVWFSEAEGGILCQSCSLGTPGRAMEVGELDAFQSLFRGVDTQDARLDDRLEELLRFHLGRALRTSRHMDSPND